jgi:hypothetical protein
MGADDSVHSANIAVRQVCHNRQSHRGLDDIGIACRLSARRPEAVLMGKPGLDGHSNGARQSLRRRDYGMDITQNSGFDP